VLTDVGAAGLAVPRDRNGSFEPLIVRKGQTRLEGFNERVIAPYARGMTVRGIRARLREMYDAGVLPGLVSRVTDGVPEELQERRSRPLEQACPVAFTGALMVKVRDGVVASRPACLATGTGCEGARQVLGLWAGPAAGEPAKFWLTVLSELKGPRRGRRVHRVLRRLTGLPGAISVTWPRAVVHLIRASLRCASRGHWVPLARGLRPACTAPGQNAAAAALEVSAAAREGRYPAVIRLWRAHREEFTPFPAFPPEVRRVACTTNLIESVNARLRKVTRNRGQFPSEQAALKVLCLAVRNLEEFRTPAWESAAPGGSRRCRHSRSTSTDGSPPHENRHDHLHRRSDAPEHFGTSAA
jgi:transposase-like protein